MRAKEVDQSMFNGLSLFGAQLKKPLVSKEDRADLPGHGGDSETSERYCEPHEIDPLFWRRADIDSSFSLVQSL